jgi:hypothetical protein
MIVHIKQFAFDLTDFDDYAGLGKALPDFI